LDDSDEGAEGEDAEKDNFFFCGNARLDEHGEGCEHAERLISSYDMGIWGA